MNKVNLLIISLTAILPFLGCSVKGEHARLSSELQPQCQNLVDQTLKSSDSANPLKLSALYPVSQFEPSYNTHLSDLSQDTGDLPLDSNINGGNFANIQKEALLIFEKDFNLSKINSTPRMIKSLQNALTLMCLTTYQKEQDPIKVNWYDLLQTRMKSIQIHSIAEESCKRNVLAFVQYSDDSERRQIIHLCPKFGESSNVLDMAVTLLHESRHADNQGWYTNDFRQISMSNFFQNFGQSYRDYFQSYGSLDAKDRFTNNRNMPGYPHAPCDDNFSGETAFIGEPACDPVFEPFQNIIHAGSDNLGAGAYSYDVYFYSRISMTAQNVLASAINWSCDEGFMLFNTRFSRYEDETGLSTKQPSNTALKEAFNKCLTM